MNRKSNYYIFAALVVIALAALAVIYASQKTEITQVAARPKILSSRPAIHMVSWPDFTAAVAQIRKGDKVLVEDELKSLVPPGVETGRFANHVPFRSWVIPDRRMNPADADYILSHDVFDLQATLFGPNPPWRIVAAFQGGNSTAIYLAKRIAPIGQQLAPEMSENALRQALEEMVKIDWGATPGEHTRPFFYFDRYEATNELFARFLNDIGIGFDEAIVYYGIKDPASRIVYFQGRYRVYRGSERLPVYNVSRYGAQAFCGQYGKRLVKFSEWLKVSGYADDQRTYPWGNQIDFASRANFQGDADGYLFWAPVEAFPAGVSPYGVYNMAGNVTEWIEFNSLAGKAFELGHETGRTSKLDVNDPLTRNLHDGFRCASDERPR